MPRRLRSRIAFPPSLRYIARSSCEQRSGQRVTRLAAEVDDPVPAARGSRRRARRARGAPVLAQLWGRGVAEPKRATAPSRAARFAANRPRVVARIRLLLVRLGRAPRRRTTQAEPRERREHGRPCADDDTAPRRSRLAHARLAARPRSARSAGSRRGRRSAARTRPTVCGARAISGTSTIAPLSALEHRRCACRYTSVFPDPVAPPEEEVRLRRRRSRRRSAQRRARCGATRARAGPFRRPSACRSAGDALLFPPLRRSAVRRARARARASSRSSRRATGRGRRAPAARRRRRARPATGFHPVRRGSSTRTTIPRVRLRPNGSRRSRRGRRSFVDRVGELTRQRPRRHERVHRRERLRPGFCLGVLARPGRAGGASIESVRAISASAAKPRRTFATTRAMFMPTLNDRISVRDGLALEQEHDQSLFRPRTTRGRREEGRQRVDDLDEQRVVDRRVDAERLQEVVEGAQTEDPRLPACGRITPTPEVAADRGGSRNPASTCERNSRTRRRDHGRTPRCPPDGEDPEDRGAVTVVVLDQEPQSTDGRTRVHLPRRQDADRSRPDHERSGDEEVEDRLDDERRRKRRVGRALDPVLDEVELHEVAAARGRDRVDPDSRDVGAEDRRVARRATPGTQRSGSSSTRSRGRRA